MEKGEKDFIIVRNVFRSDLKTVYKNEFSGDDLLLYVTMQRYTNFRGRIEFTLGWIYQDLNIQKNKTLTQSIKKSLYNLKNMDLIKGIELESSDNIDKNTKITLQSIFCKDNFTAIYDKEIDKILCEDIDIRNKRSMLYLFCDIVSRIDSKGYCYPSFEVLKRNLKTTSDNRVSDNLDMLKKLGLIHYTNIGLKVDEDGSKTQANNVYVRCIDENHLDYLEEALMQSQKNLENQGYKIEQNVDANTKRSESMKQYHLAKKENIKGKTNDEILLNSILGDLDIDRNEAEINNLNMIDISKFPSVESQVEQFVKENKDIQKQVAYDLFKDFSNKEMIEVIRDNIVYDCLVNNKDQLLASSIF